MWSDGCIALNVSIDSRVNSQGRRLAFCEGAMSEEIQGIFQTRDEAVRKQDAQLFESTQLQGIAFASIESYLSINDMTTEVLYVHEGSDDELVVLAQETYKPRDRAPHSSYLLYFLTNTRKGLKIYKIR